MNCRMDINNRFAFSKDMKIAELLDADCSLLTVLLRLDMQLPFGDLSVEEMCERYGVSVELFLMLCRVWHDTDYVPEVENLNVADLKYLLTYLRASHHLYLEEYLPSIGEGVERVLECCSARERTIVLKFYKDYLSQVRAHLECEENCLFPYVEQLMQGVVRQAEGVAEAMDQHTDICEKIDDVKSILIKYLPESCTIKQRYALLCDIFRMRDDLVRHTLIEKRILAPAVAFIERRLRDEAI